ncbi:MAG: putative phosphodiesterase [Marmoricola sp.]|nr:putative phosphodiesterase [Marmoricola sp.]
MVLAAATRVIALLRPADKPLHPDGSVFVGHLDRRGSTIPSGVAWLDERGRDEVVVRLSRAIGLAVRLPDIHGLAVRVPVSGEHGDLLFASTGWGRVGRFVLTLGRGPGSRPLTTLLPYVTSSGALVLGARASGSESYELFWATYDGPWQSFATLEITHQVTADPEISFDPVVNQIPGLAQYPTVVRLRERAYRLARRTR